jgi:hypothetical protein
MEARTEQARQSTRMSTRIASQATTIGRVDDGVRHQNQTGAIPGTNLNSVNSFVALDDDDICARALEMGINPETFNLEKINHLKALEIARHNLTGKINNGKTLMWRNKLLIVLRPFSWVLVKRMWMRRDLL